MEKLIALFKKFVLGQLSLDGLTPSFDKLEADLKSYGQQQIDLAEKLKAKADKIEKKREAALELKEKAERIAGRIQALTE